MKIFMTYLTLIFFFVTTTALAAVITDDKVELGKPSSTNDKQLIFSGPTKKKLTHKNATNTLEYDGNNLTVGDGANSSKVIKFNKGASSPEIRYNSSTSKLEFSNDAAVYKAIGSGTGGGSGINLLDNSGFEDGVAVSWTSSGASLVEVNTGSNLLYELKSASWTPTAAAQYFESSVVTVPVILYGADCMVKVSYKGADANVYLTVLDGSSVELIPSTARATLNTSTGSKTAKVYFTCPSSGSVKLRVQSTAAGVIGYYDQAVVGESDFKSVNRNSTLISYAPTVTGAGTIVNEGFYYKINNDTLDIYGTFVTGTVTGSVVSITLPQVAGQTLAIDSTKAGIAADANSWGVAYNPSSASSIPSVGAGPFVVFSDTGVNSNLLYLATGTSSARFTKVVGTTLGSTVRIRIEARGIPIVGWGATEHAINAKCVSDVACENTFSAFSSVAGVVSLENLDWLNGNCVVSDTSLFTCSINSGIFAGSQPICTASIANDSSGVSMSANVVTTSTSQVIVRTLSGGGKSAQPFFLTCQKTGSDYKARQNIQGFLSSTITSTANNLRIEYFNVGGTGGAGTNCSTTPCNIFNSSMSGASVVRASAGNYLLHFPAGTFSSPPSCTCSATQLAITGLWCGRNNTVSNTSFAFITANIGGTLVDTESSIVCVGPR